MAIYSTFFLCKPKELSAGFPGWRLPLPQPVRREFKDPFTGEMTTIETREPEWPDDGDTQAFDRDYGVVAIQGNYEDYLEGRLPPFVRAQPHWCAKNLTEVELSPLGQAADVEPALEYALYSPPSSGAVLQQLRPDLLAKLVGLDQKGLEAIAKRWAATMSTPEYTHSVTGVKLSEGWAASEAMDLLQPIIGLGRQRAGDQEMYLLIEA